MRYSQKVSFFLFVFSWVFFPFYSFAFPFGPAGTPPPSVSVSLEPDRLEAISGGEPVHFSVLLDVPANHHAYLDRGDEGYYLPVEIMPALKDDAGVDIPGLFLEESRPAGEREPEIKAQVLRGKGTFLWLFKGVLQNNARYNGTSSINIRYQICNDETKVCYPPAVSVVKLPLTVSLPSGENKTGKIRKVHSEQPEKPAASEISPQQDAPKKNEDLQTWLLETYHHYSQNLLIAFFLALSAGLLAAATPCVYPMLPITYGILSARGKGSKRAELLHAFSYFLGIILIYGFMGIFAGMTGGMLNVLMQNAVTNLLLGLIFFLLALALLDFFSLSFFEGVSQKFGQTEEGNASFFSTMMMGVGAGIVVSPCVGPVVFAVLLNLADRIAEITQSLNSAGHAVSFLQKLIVSLEGGAVMAGFGIGIGLPFLLVGFLSGKMPRSGMWMVTIKNLMAVAIIAVAYLYFFKGLATAGVSAELVRPLLFGLFLLMAGGFLYLSEKRREGSDNRVTALAMLLILLGAAMLLPLMNETKKEGQVQYIEKSNTSASFEVHGNLRWHRDYQEALQEAKKSGKPLFIDFFAYWCANCIAFGELSEKNERLNRALQNVILLKVYDTDKQFEDFKKKPEHSELLVGLPYFTLLDENGAFLWDSTLYNDVDGMVNAISQAVQ